MSIETALHYIKTMQDGQQQGQKLPSLPYYIQVKAVESKQVVCIYILNEIMAPFLYVPLLHILNGATEDMEIFVYLSSPGGRLDTGIAIYDAMKRCKGTVTTIGMDIVASSTALIFMGGKTTTTLPWSHVMFHNASYGAMGTNNVIKNQVTYTAMLVGDILKTARDLGMLTDEEVAIIFNSDADVYVDHTTLTERLSLRNQHGEVGGSSHVQLR